jgi:hypothetical protein
MLFLESVIDGLAWLSVASGAAFTASAAAQVMRPASGGRQQVRIPNSQGKITECSLCNNETGNPLPCPLGEESPPWWRDGPSRAYGAPPPDGPL